MLIQPKHRCYCGSEHCSPFACRFYRSEEEAKLQQEQFYKDWAQMEAREADEQR